MSDRPRVFVSSIMEGYGEFRQAARKAIERAGGAPVLIEEQPSSPVSPRTACLDLVASSDALLAIIGPRGGFRAPSGSLVIREEFDEARTRNMPALLLVQDTTQDADAQQLTRELSEWVSGRLRQTFSTPAELEAEVEKALRPLLETMSRPQQDPNVVQESVEEPRHGGGQHDASLRLVFAPAVAEEVFDPLSFDTRDFQKRILREAHDCDLLEYQHTKKVRATSDRLEIEQTSERRQGQGFAQITIKSSGLVELTIQVTGASQDAEASTPGFLSGGFSSGFEILRSRLEKTCSAGFEFMVRLLQYLDPHERHSTWIYNAALVNPGMRRIVETAARANQVHSLSLDETKVVTSYDRPRSVNRSALARPQDEIQRTLTLLQKRHEEARNRY